jgi:ferrochelatase
MRYGRPSIASVVAQLAADGIEEALLFPQYPHYAMASWETVVVKVQAEAAKLAPNLKLTCVAPFYADDDYIAALYTVSAPWLSRPHDHLLFSYHGLPARHMRKADPTGCHCLATPDCCTTPSPAHATCYRAQVFATTRAFAARAGLAPARHSVSFQSRLAGEPWLEPYTDVEFQRLAAAGVKHLLVICPAFVTDCLETLEEIAMRGRELYLEAGGESYEQIPCLNDQAPFIDFLAGRVRRWLAASG